MNYIKRLEKENKELRDTLRGRELAELELRTYLLSSKFHSDPTVQVQDVLNRLDEIRAIDFRGVGV